MRWLLLLLLAACSSPSSAPADLRMICAAPGAPGNRVGVGRSCGSGDDCPASASLCVPLVGEGRSFCTRLCASESDPACGESARCACAGGGCTCLPAECEP